MSPLTLLRAGVTLAGDVATPPRYFIRAHPLGGIQESPGRAHGHLLVPLWTRRRRPLRRSEKGVR